MPLTYSLPRRRKVVKSGIERGPKRRWPRHEAFVRRHQCIVPGCENGPIEFMHVRSAANSGVGIKPHSCFGVSGCQEHHREQHQIGQPAFEAKYGINMRALALEFTRRSPDHAMRESLKLMEPSNV